MDIEGSEWSSLESAMASNSLKNVKQLAMEIHLTKYNADLFRMYYDVLTRLRNYGFLVWMSNENIQSRRLSNLTNQYRFWCYEIVLINVHFMPKKL